MSEVVTTETVDIPIVTPEEGIEDLRAKLAASEARETAERNARADAERRAAAAQQESVKFQTAAQQSQYDGVSRALEATNLAIETAQNEYAAAMEAGDYKAAAKATAAITKASTRQTQLEDGKAHMERMRANPPPQRQSNPAEDRISQFSPRTQQWLRNHPDAVTDPAKQNRVTAAHYDAVADGHVPDSDAYFDFIETRVGYKQPSQQQLPAPTRQNQRQPMPSAPVSSNARQPNGQQQSSTRISLTANERDAARISGVTEEDYARELMKLRAAGEIN